MAPLGNIAALVLDEVQEAVDAGASDVKALAVEAADGWRRRSEEAAERIAVEAAPLLHGVIVTSSYSSTVLRALGRNRARLERVFVGEGRPRLEGRATARELAQAGTPVVLVTDALASHSVVEADAVVVGADAVTASGAVVNKAGTYALALAARDRKVPFYVLADTLKLWPRREPPPLESRPGAELWPEAAPGVEVSNVTFDITPGRLVAGYVTEEGCMDRRRIASRAKVLAQARRRVGL